MDKIRPPRVAFYCDKHVSPESFTRLRGYSVRRGNRGRRLYFTTDIYARKSDLKEHTATGTARQREPPPQWLSADIARAWISYFFVAWEADINGEYDTITPSEFRNRARAIYYRIRESELKGQIDATGYLRYMENRGYFENNGFNDLLTILNFNHGCIKNSEIISSSRGGIKKM